MKNLVNLTKPGDHQTAGLEGTGEQAIPICTEYGIDMPGGQEESNCFIDHERNNGFFCCDGKDKDCPGYKPGPSTEYKIWEGKNE